MTLSETLQALGVDAEAGVDKMEELYLRVLDIGSESGMTPSQFLIGAALMISGSLDRPGYGSGDWLELKRLLQKFATINTKAVIAVELTGGKTVGEVLTALQIAGFEVPPDES